MAFLDDFSKKAAKFTEKTVEKSNELAETAKTKISIKSTEADLDKAFEELGKKYYQVLKNSEIPDDTKELVDNIDQILSKLKALNEQLNNA